MGAGLGLTIAADVARRTGGDLQVETAFGDYAEFLMTLPVAEAPPGFEVDDEDEI